MTARPLDVLDKAKEKRVIISLKNGTEVTGTLKAFDLHLNIWLENAIQRKDESEIKLGSVLVRGDTIILVSPAIEWSKWVKEHLHLVNIIRQLI